MDCCKADSIDPSVDKLLSDARLVLLASQAEGLNFIVPIPGVGPITNVLISLIDKISKMRSNHKDLKVVSREVSQLVNTVYRAMSKVAHDIQEISFGDPLRHALVDGLRGSLKLEHQFSMLFRDLGELKIRVDELYDRPWWLRSFYNSRDARTFYDIRRGITVCRDYFESECQVAIEAAMEEAIEKNFSAAVKEVVVQVAANHSYDRDERILESLPHAEANYRANVNSTKRSFLPGTRVELFSVINQWVERQTPELSDKAICILTGGAGTGKSTIASEFARQRDEKKDYGASFFFVRGVADLDSTRLVFPTLAYQLAQSQDALRGHIVKAAHQHLKRGKAQQMKYEAQNLIHRPVHKVSGRHPPVVLIIDALDDCSEEMPTLVPEMLDRELLIASVRHARFPLRIFFTSRPNSLIENTLQQSQWARLAHKISLHDLSPESVQRDMEIFVRNELEKSPSGHGRALLQERPEVAERLAERAGGQFLYAKAVVGFLGKYSGSVEHGLDKSFSESMRELQIENNDYLTVLKREFPPSILSQDPRLLQALESTLGSIAILRHPISPVALESLNGVPRMDTRNVLNRLHSLLVYDPDRPSKKFRPLHATFPQFLLNSDHCKGTVYHVDASRQHSGLAAGCLRALLTLESNMCDISDHWQIKPTTEIPELAKQLQRHVPEHVQYACAHWAVHLGHACGLEQEQEHAASLSACSCKDIGERLESFASKKLKPWVEVMSYMGRLDMVTGALDAACTYLEGALQYRRAVSMLNRMRKFVMDNYSVIEEYPSYVYRDRLVE